MSVVEARAEKPGPRRALFKVFAVVFSASLAVPVALWLFVPETTAWMLSAVCSQGSPGLRLWGVRRMAGLGPAALEPLMLHLDDPDRDVEELTREAIAAFPPERVGPRLIKALNRDPKLHLHLLRLIFRRLDRYPELVLESARSDDPGLRRRAFALLFLINDRPLGALQLGTVSVGPYTPVEIQERHRALFQTEEFRGLYREALDDADPEVALLAALILSGEEGAALSEPRAARLFLDHHPSNDLQQRAALFQALAKLAPQAIAGAIAEAPERRGLALLRLLTRGLASEKEMVQGFHGSFGFSKGQVPGLGIDGAEGFRKLAPLLPRDEHKVQDELIATLEAFRKREPAGWPRGAYFLRPLKLNPEPYIPALAAARGSPADDEAFAILKDQPSKAARRALRAWLVADLKGPWGAAAMRAVGLLSRRKTVLEGAELQALLSQADKNPRGSWGALMRYARTIAPASSKTARAVLLKLSETGDADQSGRALAAVQELTEDEAGDDRP